MCSVRSARAGEWQGYAILVGVSEYPPGYNGLQFCDDDALDIRDALLCDPAHWSSDNIEVILNRDAEFSFVRDRVLAMQSRATGTDDVFLFFFSGHGSRADDDSSSPLPDDETGASDTKDEVLVVWNDTGDDIDYIYDDHLGQWLSGFTCGNVCVIVDSCYSGGMEDKALSGAPLEPWTDGLARDLASRFDATFAAGGTKDLQDSGHAGLVALMACNENELSREDPVLANGVFAFFVVEGLRRAATNLNPPDEYTSAEEVFAYAAPLAASWEPDPGSPQTPQLYDADAGSELELVRAGDYGTFKVVRPEDLPFGGGGCAGGPGRGASFAPVALLFAALVASRRRSRRAIASVSAACLCGCMAYAPQTQYVWTPQGYVPASPQAAPAATQPLAGTPYYVWTPRGYMLVYPQAQPAAVQPAAKEVAAAPGEGTSPGGGGEQARPASAPAPESTQPPAAGAQAPPAAPPLAAGQAAPAPLVLPSPALPGPWRTGPRPKIGLRAGVVAPLGEQNASYAAAAQAGLFVSGMLPGDRLEYEAGLDFFSLEGTDVEAGGDVACARLDFVFARKGLSRAAEPYLAAGPRLYADRARTYWGTTSELAAGVSLAGGARRTGSGWDARLGLDILVGSENIRGFLSLLAGAKF